MIRQTELVHIGTATEPITAWMRIALLGQNEAIVESGNTIAKMQDATEWRESGSFTVILFDYFIPQ